MLELLLISVLLLGLCFVGLGVRIFFHRSHQFPCTSVGGNAALRRQGLCCPREDEARLHGGAACQACAARRGR